MARKPQDTVDYSDEIEPGTDVAQYVEDDDAQGELELAAQRASSFVARRGYGPNTTRLIAYIAEQAAQSADLNVIITEQLAERLLNAQSADDILQPFDPESGKQYYGKSLLLMGATFIESDFEGFPWYVSLECKRPGSGEMFVVTVGGEKVVMQAGAAHANGHFPMFVELHQADKQTKAGFYPLELRPGNKI